MATVMKTPTSHRQFQEFIADQVDTTRNLSRFTFTLDEMLAAVQLASFQTSDCDVLKLTRHKVLRQIESKSASLSTTLINATATQLFKKSARAGSALPSDEATRPTQFSSLTLPVPAARNARSTVSKTVVGAPNLAANLTMSSHLPRCS